MAYDDYLNELLIWPLAAPQEEMHVLQTGWSRSEQMHDTPRQHAAKRRRHPTGLTRERNRK